MTWSLPPVGPRTAPGEEESNALKLRMDEETKVSMAVARTGGSGSDRAGHRESFLTRFGKQGSGGRWSDGSLVEFGVSFSR